MSHLPLDLNASWRLCDVTTDLALAFSGLILGQLSGAHRPLALTGATDYKLMSDLLAETEAGVTRTTIGGFVQIVGAIHTLKASL